MRTFPRLGFDRKETFYLSRNRLAASADPSRKAWPQMSRLLLVDDQDDIRLLIRTVMARADWDVVEADSGEAALEIWRSDGVGFDLVILDYTMPGMSGLDVARALHDERVTTPILLHSAYLTPAVETEADALGLVTVPKGDVSELRDTVRRYEVKPT